MSLAININIFQAIMKPDVVYGSETWSVTEMDMHGVYLCERMYRATVEQGMWIIITDGESREPYTGLKAVTVINMERTEWLGRNGSVVQKIFERKQEGKRRMDRPSLGWLEDFEKDVQEMI